MHECLYLKFSQVHTYTLKKFKHFLKKKSRSSRPIKSPINIIEENVYLSSSESQTINVYTCPFFSKYTSREITRAKKLTWIAMIISRKCKHLKVDKHYLVWPSQKTQDRRNDWIIKSKLLIKLERFVWDWETVQPALVLQIEK